MLRMCVQSFGPTFANPFHPNFYSLSKTTEKEKKGDGFAVGVVAFTLFFEETVQLQFHFSYKLFQYF